MKILYASILFLFIVSCNPKQAEVSKWTDEEKDLTYKECIAYAIDIREMSIDKSDNYCQCNLDIITTEFESNEDARIKIGNDISLRSLFEACDN